MKGPEQRTIDVDVESLDTRGRTVVGYAATYGVPSEPLADLGGAREQIRSGAFKDVLGSDVRALLNHDPNEVLGRTKAGTLRLFDEERGLRFELDLPDSPLGENVRTAVKRGDIDGASFRFVVADEEWAGEVRTITRIAELHDVTVATYPAYAASSIELRTRTEAPKMEEAVEEHEGAEERSQEEVEATVSARKGGLRVADANGGEPESRTLYGQFKKAGWTPGGGRTEISWNDFETASESRALTWTGAAGVNVARQAHRDPHTTRITHAALPMGSAAGSNSESSPG